MLITARQFLSKSKLQFSCILLSVMNPLKEPVNTVEPLVLLSCTVDRSFIIITSYNSCDPVLEIMGLGLKTLSFIPPDDLSPTPNHDNFLVKHITNLLPNHDISIIQTKFRIQSNPGLEHPITVHWFRPLHTPTSAMAMERPQDFARAPSSITPYCSRLQPLQSPLHNRNFQQS
jgi:hypothetical protein